MTSSEADRGFVVAELRKFMLTHHGTDYGASDDQLAAASDRAREYLALTGYRMSWKSIAADQIRVAASGPEQP